MAPSARSAGQKSVRVCGGQYASREGSVETGAALYRVGSDATAPVAIDDDYARVPHVNAPSPTWAALTFAANRPRWRCIDALPCLRLHERLPRWTCADNRPLQPDFVWLSEPLCHLPPAKTTAQRGLVCTTGGGVAVCFSISWGCSVASVTARTNSENFLSSVVYTV
jgi:hypothetical protein